MNSAILAAFDATILANQGNTDTLEGENAFNHAFQLAEDAGFDTESESFQSAIYKGTFLEILEVAKKMVADFLG